MNPVRTQNSLTEVVLERIKAKEAHVAIIGLGYVGLPLALLFCEEGFRVTGIDVDKRKIDVLSDGRSYMHRVPPTEIQAAKERGLRPSSDYSCIEKMDAVVICVPTPLNEYQQPDLSFIVSTMEGIAPYLMPGQLIVLESTTYPGTTQEVVIPLLERGNTRGLVAARDSQHSDSSIFVAFSPEREDPGNNSVARRDIPKIVGGLDVIATELAVNLYRGIFNRVVPVSSPSVAEMTKLLENIYRCVNIALVNELKLLCLRMGLDIWEVIEAASTKPFGFQPFQPGPGLGGHCIPVDPFYLSWKAREWDFHTRFIELAGEINTSMPYHVVESIITELGKRRKPLNGAKILVLGVAYKKDVDDFRESPSLKIIELLQHSGAEVSYNDPYFCSLPKMRKYDLQLSSVPVVALDKYDCVAIITDHSDYDIPQIVRDSSLVIDTRNATKGIASPNVVRC